jgi:hypothetical protein
MSSEDQASLVSIRARIARLEADLCALQSVQGRMPAGRESTLNVMAEIAGEIEGLTREARRLERTLRADNQSRQP